MNILQAIILGIVQGLTEFLPISSSAHLVLVPYFLGWRIPQPIAFSFDVLVQLGTLAAVIVYFRKELLLIIKAVWKGVIEKDLFSTEDARLGWLLVLATLPGIATGLFLKDTVERAFSNPILTAFFLFGTSFLMVIAELVGKRSREITSLTWLDALWVGLFQALSIFPGISRSGSTISAGMMRNVKRKSSSKFSFLMSIPIMLGAGVVSFVDLIHTPELSDIFIPIVIGFISAAITGYFAIRWLLGYISKHSFFAFAIYCVLLGMGSLAFTFINPNQVQQSQIDNQSSDFRISIPAEIQPLIASSESCTSAAKPDELLFFADDPNTFDNFDIDAFISYSDGSKSFPYQYRLGMDILELAVNNQNPVTSLSQKVARQVFTGKLRTWGEVIDACPSCFSEALSQDWRGKSISVLVFSEGSFLQKLLRETILGSDFASPEAVIAPGPKEMLQALSINPASIGFIPSTWLGASLKPITLSDGSTNPINIAIIASTRVEPKENLEAWFLCVQNNLLKITSSEGEK